MPTSVAALPGSHFIATIQRVQRLKRSILTNIEINEPNLIFLTVKDLQGGKFRETGPSRFVRMALCSTLF
jgi:hypothetical protein